MFKISLKHYTSINNGNILIIDEMLGKISSNNYKYLINLFNIIKQEYNYCFVISHVQEIQSLLEYENEINIIKDNNYSYIK